MRVKLTKIHTYNLDHLCRPFWQEASGQAVVIEADAFKETDLFYRALSSRGHHDAVHTAELVIVSSSSPLYNDLMWIN